MMRHQHKDHVLIVPQQAIRTAGERWFVEVADADGQRNVDVQTRISHGGDTEIMGGRAAEQVSVIGQWAGRSHQKHATRRA